MPEAGEGFDFTSYIGWVARVCREQEAGKTSRNDGDYVYTIDTFSLQGLDYAGEASSYPEAFDKAAKSLADRML
jgi:hypothetical protein